MAVDDSSESEVKQKTMKDANSQLIILCEFSNANAATKDTMFLFFRRFPIHGFFAVIHAEY